MTIDPILLPLTASVVLPVIGIFDGRFLLWSLPIALVVFFVAALLEAPLPT